MTCRRAPACTFPADGLDGLCRVCRHTMLLQMGINPCKIYWPYIAAGIVAAAILFGVALTWVPVEQLFTTHPTLEEWKR